MEDPFGIEKGNKGLFRKRSPEEIASALDDMYKRQKKLSKQSRKTAEDTGAIGESLARGMRRGTQEASRDFVRFRKLVRSHYTKSSRESDRFQRVQSTQSKKQARRQSSDERASANRALKNQRKMQQSSEEAVNRFSQVIQTFEEMSATVSKLDIWEMMGEVGSMVTRFLPQLSAYGSVVGVLGLVANNIRQIDDATEGWTKSLGDGYGRVSNFVGSMSDMGDVTHLTEDKLYELADASFEAGLGISELDQSTIQYIKTTGLAMKMMDLSAEDTMKYARALHEDGVAFDQLGERMSSIYETMTELNLTTKDQSAIVHQAYEHWSQFGGALGQSVEQFQQGLSKSKALFKALNMDASKTSEILSTTFGDFDARLQRSRIISSTLGISPQEVMKMAVTDPEKFFEKSQAAGVVRALQMSGSKSNLLGADQSKLSADEAYQAQFMSARIKDHIMGALDLKDEEASSVLRQIEMMNRQGLLNGDQATVQKRVEDNFHKIFENYTKDAKKKSLEEGYNALAVTGKESVNELIRKIATGVHDIAVVVRDDIGPVFGVLRSVLEFFDLWGNTRKNFTNVQKRMKQDLGIDFGDMSLTNLIRQGGNLLNPSKGIFDLLRNNPMGVRPAVAGPASSLFGAGTSSVAPQLSGGSDFASRLVQTAEATAKSMNTMGWCALGVTKALKPLGVNLTGHAWQAKAQLEKNKRFQKVSDGSIQPGDILVHQPNPKGKGRTIGEQTYGHIAVALPGGMEASDHIQKLIGPGQGQYGNTDIFRPIGSAPAGKGKKKNHYRIPELHPEFYKNLPVVVEAFRKKGVDPALGVATMIQESRGNSKAINKNGLEESVGLFQHNKRGGMGAGVPNSKLMDPKYVSEKTAGYFSSYIKAHPGADPGAIAAGAQRPQYPEDYRENINQIIPMVQTMIAKLDQLVEHGQQTVETQKQVVDVQKKALTAGIRTQMTNDPLSRSYQASVSESLL